jgi:hypothetical protein
MTKQGNLYHLDNIKYFNSNINLLSAHSVIIIIIIIIIIEN